MNIYNFLCGGVGGGGVGGVIAQKWSYSFS